MPVCYVDAAGTHVSFLRHPQLPFSPRLLLSVPETRDGRRSGYEPCATGAIQPAVESSPETARASAEATRRTVPPVSSSQERGDRSPPPTAAPDRSLMS